MKVGDLTPKQRLAHFLILRFMDYRGYPRANADDREHALQAVDELLELGDLIEECRKESGQ
jgi:hypothetical protein